MRKWKVLGSRRIFKSKYMNVLEQRCRMFNGKIAENYYLIEKKDVALVFALTKNGKVILVNEYKHGAGEFLLQLPIGFIERGEEPKKAAMRELAEETGYTASKVRLIGKYISSPSDMTNRIYLFFAKDAVLTKTQHLDETEEIEVRLMTFGKLVMAVKSGKIRVMPHMAAILLMEGLMRQQKGPK